MVEGSGLASNEGGETVGSDEEVTNYMDKGADGSHATNEINEGSYTGMNPRLQSAYATFHHNQVTKLDYWRLQGVQWLLPDTSVNSQSI